jgi:hypothetical protein
MPPNDLIGLAIAAVGAMVTVGAAVGLPAIAVIAVRFFKFKERELTVEMEYRQKSQQQDLALEKRVQRLEEVLTSLDHDVRTRLRIEPGPATSLSSRPELASGPPAPETQSEDSAAPISRGVR